MSFNECSEGEVNPFLVVDSPVDSFLEVPVVGCSDIESVEIQRLVVPGDSVSVARASGFGAVVHTPDGVDYYVGPELGLDRQWFDSDPAFANLSRGQFNVAEIDVARWKLDGDFVDVEVSFDLADGRSIEFRVNQARGREVPAAQFIPTPVLDELAVLRFLEVRGFGLLRRSSSVDVRLQGERLCPALFPFPIGGKRRYSARYAASCQLFGLNPAGSFTTTGGRFAATELSAPSPGLGWEFLPELPTQMEDGHRSEGCVTFEMEIGLVGKANYSISASAGGWDMELTRVRQEWKPPPGQIQLRSLAALRRKRRRHQDWVWTGSARPSVGAESVNSTWSLEAARPS